MTSTQPTTKTDERKSARRTCVGCGKVDAPQALVRVVLGPGGEVAADLAGGSAGRGAHVHPAPSCLQKACRGGLARAFKRAVACDAGALASDLVSAAERRIEGLLQGARRAGHLAIGADAAAEALHGGAPLAVVAADAGSIVERATFARAIAEGRAVVFQDKARLGVLLSRGAASGDEVAVAAIVHPGIATQVQRTKLFSDSARGEACRSREDR
jgi:hypothetical protein